MSHLPPQNSSRLSTSRGAAQVEVVPPTPTPTPHPTWVERGGKPADTIVPREGYENSRGYSDRA